MVSIEVDRKNPSSCATGAACTYSYTDDSTPFFKFLYTQSVVPSSRLILNGFWRMGSTSQISKIRITEDFLCDIFLESLNPDEDLNSGAYQNIYCGLSSEIPAGLYNLTFKTTLGSPFNHFHSFQTTADG